MSIGSAAQLEGAVDLDEIEYHKNAGIAEVTLNRPATLNPISARPGGTRDQILWALSDAEQDDSIGAVLVSGAGKAFSAGGDITGNAARKGVAGGFRFQESADEFHRRLRQSPLPVVAAVHGYCLGAGLLLAASCDFLVAARGALFGMPEGRIGLAGASYLVALVGRQWAKFLMLTGEMISADRARELGLALTVLPDEELAGATRDLAARLARMPRQATMLNKRAVDAVADASGDDAGRIAARGYDAVTLAASGEADAPDGRTFTEIRETEGVEGLKAARADQYSSPWLR